MSTNRELFDLLNQFFDKIYLISLRKSNERRAILKKSLKGLDYEIFWGVNGSELNLDKLNRDGIIDFDKQKKINRYQLSSGEIGCALSHMGIYQSILDKNLKNALILEDDLLLDDTLYTEDPVTNLRYSLNELPDNWELLYLGYADNNSSMNLSAHFRAWFAYPFLSLWDRKRFDPVKFRRRFPRKYSAHLQRAGYHFRTHSYGISNSGAKKALSFQTPVLRAADNAISEMCSHGSIRAFRVKHRIFYQNRDLPTTIGDRYTEDDKSPHISDT